MLHTYYLGANTPAGFRSEYGTLQSDPRIRRLLILKGGSGCGKSTLMRAVGTRAEQLGWQVERILCSSDPDSLDGLVIPALGLALADGTAPHVLEPELCGCGANYLNLGEFYREADLAPRIPAIRRQKLANGRCYPPAYACLRAAGELQQSVRKLAAPSRELTGLCLSRLLEHRPGRGSGEGRVRRLYLSALTPKGPQYLSPDCGELWELTDRFGWGGTLLTELAKELQSRGFDLVLAMDPMAPEEPAGVLVPELDFGCLRSSRILPLGRGALVRLDLDRAVEETLEPFALRRAEAALEQCVALVGEAVCWLEQAKACHDRLEELCRTGVDFAGITRITEALSEQLLTEA